MSCFIIGVAGGSGSGKSTVADHIVNAIGRDKVAILRQDYYYNDLSHLPLEERRKVNFAHPDAFDWELLYQHIHNLYNGLPIEMPIHDYSLYIRKSETITITPAQVVVFECIFALMESELRNIRRGIYKYF